MNRILVFHDKTLSDSITPFGATYYLERDYAPSKLRIYARNAPDGGDLEVDIRDDGVSIMANRASSYATPTTEDSVIAYGTLSGGTFRVAEIIDGGTSGASGKVTSDRLGMMTLRLIGTTAFTAEETITGKTSLATAKVHNFVRHGDGVLYTSDAAKQTAILADGSNLEEIAQDFLAAEPTIEAGSLVTCYIIAASGAGDITVQFELESLDEESEEPDES